MTQSRNICITWNNPPLDYERQIREWATCSYFVLGEEKGQSGTPHIQGYLEFEKPQRFTTLHKRIKSIHIEARKGTAKQASDYCKKDGKFVEHGTISQQGKRSDLDNVRDLLSNPLTANMRTITLTATSCQSVKFAELYLKYHEAKRDFKPFIVWYYGPAGSGKSARAIAYGKRAGDVHIQTVTNKWWDGYDGHTTVLIDDIRESFCKYETILTLLDRYEFRVETKGGTRQLKPRYIFITSPENPAAIWTTKEEMYQLVRRIDVIAHVKSFTEVEYIQGDALPDITQEEIFPQASQDADLRKGLERREEVCEEPDQESSPRSEECLDS
jgi:hypothetical protein